jgi:hypothetical protein
MSGLRAGRLLLLLFAVLASSWAAWRSVHAEVSRSALALSRLALDLPAEWSAAAPRELWVNGAHIRIITGRSELELPALLARLEASCLARSKLVSEPLRRWLGGKLPSIADGVVRMESESEGVVACLELGETPLGAWGLLRKLQRFERALDLAELGALRTVRVEAREHGSFFVAVLSEGPLPLTTMFPPAGDAPGFDLEPVGRPPNMRRVFSALQQGGEPAIAVYEGEGASEPPFQEFAARLLRSGFERLHEERSAGSRSALFRAGDRNLLLVATGDGEQSQLALIALERSFARN